MRGFVGADEAMDCLRTAFVDHGGNVPEEHVDAWCDILRFRVVASFVPRQKLAELAPVLDCQLVAPSDDVACDRGAGAGRIRHVPSSRDWWQLPPGRRFCRVR